jgi:hypothetical protein
VSFPDLIIGGIRVPRASHLSISQDYEEIGAAELLRLGNGDGLIQSADWGKWKTSISCSGWASSGLNGIDWKNPAGVEIHCVKPMALIKPSNVIVIPGEFRTDQPVLGYAQIGSKLLTTEVSLVGNTATLAVVSGAIAYKVEWLPVLTCFCPGGVRTGYNTQGNEYSWSLEGEEL